MASAAAVAGVATFFKGGLDAAREARAAFAQTEQVIETTGGAANVSAKDVTDTAERLSFLTGVHDETIQSAENMLLTFTNVRNEVGAGNDIFDQATKLTLDIAAATGGDATQGALNLGKALNDPVAGVSSLAEVGVTFTDQQKDMIKALVEGGDTLGAQQIILAELGKEFGGQAEAQADASDKLAVRMDNLQQVAGDALLPVLDVLATVMSAVLDVFTSLPGPVQKAIAASIALAAVVTTVAVAMTSARLKTVASTVATIAKTVAEKAAAVASKAMAAAQWLINAALSANPIGLVIVAIVALVAGLVLAYKKSETFRAIVQAVFAFLKDFVIGVLTAIRDFLVAAWDAIKAATETVFNAVKAVIETIFNAVKAYFETVFGIFKAIFTTAWDVIKSVVETAINIVSDTISSVMDTITGAWEAAWTGIGDFFGGIWDGIKTTFRSAINFVIDGLNAFTSFLARLDFTIDLPDFIPGLPNEFTVGFPDLPSIPRLGTGGIVFDPTLAVVGDRRGGEAIVGIDQLPGIIREAFGGGLPGRSGPIAQITVASGSQVDRQSAANIIRALRNQRYAETGDFLSLSEAGAFA